MSAKISIVIPLQLDRRVTPNGRAHHMEKYRIAREMQHTTDLAMRAQMNLNDPVACFQTAPWPLTLHYDIQHGRGRRTLDDDNAIAAMKPIRDQIAACLGMDDKHFVTGRLTQKRDPEGKGCIIVTIASAAIRDAA